MTRRERKANSRRGKQNSRQPLKTFFILCLGEKTEPNYIKDMLKDYPHINAKYSQVIGSKRDPLSLVKKAINTLAKKSKSYDSVWVVFDKDEYTNFDEAIRLAKDNGISCAWSNSCIEFWFYLHFNNSKGAYSYKGYEDRLNKHIRDKIDKSLKYSKTMEGVYSFLKIHGDLSMAIIRAKDAMSQYHQDVACSQRNPATMMYKLVEDVRKEL